jgi:hypothetical protein
VFGCVQAALTGLAEVAERFAGAATGEGAAAIGPHPADR